jgi:DNA-binding SARP family transcriptional activator
MARPAAKAAFDHYRRGLAASHAGEPSARELLATALEHARAQADACGAALAAAALLIEGQVRSVFRRFPEHIADAAPARDAAFAWASRDDELTALSGLLAGLLYFDNDDPFLEPCVERIMALLELDLDINLRFAAGRLVLFYCDPRELRALGQRVYSLLRPSMSRSDLAPHRLAHWLVFWSRIARYAKEPRQAEAAEAEARRLAEAHDLRGIKVWLAFIEVDRSLPTRNVAQAERAVAVVEALADPADLTELQRLEFVKTKIARMKGQFDRAVFHATRASSYSTELGQPPPSRAVYLVNEAQARLRVGELTTGLRLLREAATLVPARFTDEIRDMIGLVEAYEAILAGRAEGRPLLAQAWAAMRERQFYDTFDGDPDFGAELCALALAEGIETEFVRTLIETRGISPPADAPENWPWPIRLNALGDFTLLRRGEPVTFEGKAQKRPIEFLKMLTALGGRAVPKEKLCDLLWPDAAPDAAMASLDVLVSRARKLLGDQAAIRVDEGRIGFDATRVWLDVWAFDRDIEALQQALESPAGEQVDTLATRILARYRGPFLGSEDPQRWSLPARDRWQNRFRRSLADAGQHAETRGDGARAVALYERVLEEDSLAEDLYRRLMRAHLARGEPALAARVYRRCRDMLSVQLGIAPSADTEALFRSIYSV